VLAAAGSGTTDSLREHQTLGTTYTISVAPIGLPKTLVVSRRGSYPRSMRTPSRSPTPTTDTTTRCVDSQHSSNGLNYSASYEPLVSKEIQAVDAEDPAPSKGPNETDVWLTEWQVAEDSFDVALDQHVDWDLVPMEHDWVARLFAGRRMILLQRDTYAGAIRDVSATLDWTHLSGRVTRIDQISVRYHPSEDPAERGQVPEAGGAIQHRVLNLRNPRAHHGHIIGWIVRVQG
jgi:hypothetical protein